MTKPRPLSNGTASLVAPPAPAPAPAAITGTASLTAPVGRLDGALPVSGALSPPDDCDELLDLLLLFDVLDEAS